MAGLPLHKPASREFLRADGTSVILAGALRNLKLAVTFDSARPVALTDRWDRAGRTFAAMIQLHSGTLAAGQTASVKLALALVQLALAAFQSL